MKRVLTLTISLFLLQFTVFGQSIIQQKITQKINTIEQTTKYSPLQEISTNSAKNVPIVPTSILSNKQFFEMSKDVNNSILNQKSEHLQVIIPINGQNEELQLLKADIFADDFRVVAASNPDLELDVDMGVHYWGIVKGKEKSLVTISFFESEIMGLINFDNSQYTVGKMEDNDYHILYNTEDLSYMPDFSCDAISTDDGDNIIIDETVGEKSSSGVPCVKIHMEVDYDLYQQQNGITGTTNYVNGLFAEVATLYTNENINIQISYMNIWDTPSPYSSSGNKLGVLGNQGYGKTYGDLVHLIHGSGGGGVAYLDVLCSQTNNLGVSAVGSYQSVPIYTFSVDVIAHELGHNFGSPHTHDCSWNGNNTAIDGCGPAAGYSTGCNGPIPQNGGVIMSYCHLVSVGTNFNNGFGTQPGNLIRSRYNSASCLDQCGPAPTCDDGTQNGNETGVDCGGSCAPCICNGSTITITINFDDYPQESSWEITNENGTTVTIGGNNQAAGSTKVENICLENGCYTFIMKDTYGDGICCGYGNGSYNVTDEEGNDLASGAQFGKTESTDFCLDGGGGPAPTCNDNIQNGNETGVDCGGDCADCQDCVVGNPCNDGDICTILDIFNENCGCIGKYMDSDGDNICDGSDPCPSDPTNTCDDILDYCTSEGFSTIYEYIERVAFGNIDNTSGDDNGYGNYTDQTVIVGRGDFVPLYLKPGFPGTTYAEVWNVWIDFNRDGVFSNSENAYNGMGSGTLSSNIEIPNNATLGLTKMRISMQWAQSATPCESFAYGEVEDYTVNITDTPQNFLPSEVLDKTGLSVGPAFRISPNPATDFIDVSFQYLREGGAIEVINLSGKTIWQQSTETETANVRIPLSNIPAGVYFIRLNFGSSTYATERFVKLK